MRHRFNCHHYSALKLNDLFQFFSDFFYCLFFSFSQRDAREKNSVHCSIGLSLSQSVSQIEMFRNVCVCLCTSSTHSVYIKKFKTSITSMNPKRNFVFLLFTLKTPTAVDT